MQFITRVLVVLAVLAGLGYGSYAFGKYVLSARLFGPQSSNSVTTATTGALQTPEVEVLPAPQPTENSDNSGIAPTRAPRAVATPDQRVEIIPSQSDDNSDNNNSSAGDTPRERPTRRPRRKRRARPTPRPTQRQSTTPQSPISAPPARAQNVDPPASDNNNSANNPAPRVDIPTPRDNNPAPAPTRRERERRTVPNVETPRTETPRREPRTAPTRPAPTRRRESSPVPVPEGSLGGRSESPVPMPG